MKKKKKGKKKLNFQTKKKKKKKKKKSERIPIYNLFYNKLRISKKWILYLKFIIINIKIILQQINLIIFFILNCLFKINITFFLKRNIYMYKNKIFHKYLY